MIWIANECLLKYLGWIVLMPAIYFVMHQKEGRLMGGQRDDCIDRYLIKQEHKMLMIQFYSVYKGGHLKIFSTSLCV